MERGLLMLMLKLRLIPTTHMDSDTGDILDLDTLDLDTPALDTLALDILDLDMPDLDTLVLDTPGDSMERGLLMLMLKLKLIPTTHMDRCRGYSGLGYSRGFYGKRSADADAEAKADPYYSY